MPGSMRRPHCLRIRWTDTHQPMRNSMRTHKGPTMKTLKRYLVSLTTFGLLAFGTGASAGDLSDAIALFKNSNESSAFFSRSYGYAIFPTIGEGAFVE